MTPPALPRLVFRVHAVRRMFERGIRAEEVRAVIAAGETIERYPDDTPYPRRLILGWCGTRPLHVVAADHQEANEVIVVTVYEPDPAQWDASYRRRRT